MSAKISDSFCLVVPFQYDSIYGTRTNPRASKWHESKHYTMLWTIALTFPDHGPTFDPSFSRPLGFVPSRRSEAKEIMKSAVKVHMAHFLHVLVIGCCPMSSMQARPIARASLPPRGFALYKKRRRLPWSLHCSSIPTPWTFLDLPGPR